MAESSPPAAGTAAEPDPFATVVCYNKRVLVSYDVFVLGIVCRWVWGCPRGRMLELYHRNVGARHLDLGPGTGFFLDRCRYPVDRPELTLVDLNDDVLRKSADRVQRFRPETARRDVLKPLDLGAARFDSIGMNFLLHCLPGDMAHKATVFDHAREYLAPGGRIFGSAVLAHGVDHGRLAHGALDSLNKDSTMSNRDDSLEDLEAELARRFSDHRLTVRGSVALFEIRP